MSTPGVEPIGFEDDGVAGRRRHHDIGAAHRFAAGRTGDHVDAESRAHVVAEALHVRRIAAVDLDRFDRPHGADRLRHAARIAAAADDAQCAGVGARQIFGRHAIRRAGADGVQMNIRDDGRHPHVFPVEQADDLRAVGAPVSRIDANGSGSELRRHAGQYANIVPEVPGMVGMRHRRALEMMRGARRLLLEHAFDDSDGFLVGVVARERVLHVLLGERSMASVQRHSSHFGGHGRAIARQDRALRRTAQRAQWIAGSSSAMTRATAALLRRGLRGVHRRLLFLHRAGRRCGGPGCRRSRR